EQLMSGLFGRPKPEATDTTPGSEDHEDADAIEEGHQAGEPVDTKERPVEGASAGPEPRGDAVEREGLAPAAGPGEGTGVHAPVGHPPPMLDVAEPHPAELELAERGARPPPPGTSAPLLTKASSEAPPSTAEDRAPPTAADQAPPRGANRRRPSPTRRAAIVRRAAPWRDRRASPRGLATFHQAQAPPWTRQHGDGQAWRG